MKYFAIPPIAYASLAELSDGLFILSQYLDESTELGRSYIKYCQNFKGYKIIDNGTAEKNVVDGTVLIERAKLVGANEIICPDVLFDGSQTAKQTNAFLESLSDVEKNRFVFMAVPQGKNVREYIQCAHFLITVPEITVLGISKFLAKVCRKPLHIARPAFIRTLVRSLCNTDNFLSLHDMKLHCLGMGNIYEYTAYENLDFIRSTDSCYPILLATKNIEMLSRGTKISRMTTPLNFHSCTLDGCEDLAQKNIVQAKEFLHAFGER